MLMLDLKASDSFEPSKDVKHLWLYTRKSFFHVAGLELPGLYTTKGFAQDAAAFVVVLFLEGWGLYNLLTAIGSVSSYAVGGIVAVFLLDLTLAFVRHLPASSKCRFKNKRLLAKSPHEESDAEKPYKRIKWLSPIGSVLILVLAMGKVYLFYKLNDEITGMTASVLVSYLIAAILHITNTGYFLFGLIFSLFLTRDHNKWLDKSNPAYEKLSINGTRPFTISIPLNEKIDIKQASANDHVIRKESGDGEETVLLKTSGLLTDTQLIALAGKQGSDRAKRDVALLCLDAQLSILDADPIPKQMEEPVLP